MSKKRKILIIPSWYPTIANPIAGSFFKEQAELVLDTFDIKVLYGTSEYIGYKRFYYRKFKAINKKKAKIDIHLKDETSTASLIEFTYPYIPDFKEEKNFEIMLESYSDVLEELIAIGWKPDLIHAHCTVNAGIIADHLSKRNNIPAVITEHQVFLLHNYSKYIQERVCRSLESVNKVAAVSYHQMRCILMHSINCDPVVIGNYINDEHYCLKEREREDVFKILTVTYPNWIKDNDTFFKAISLLIEKGHKNIKVTVIGNNSFSDLNKANVNSFLNLAEKYNVAQYCDLIPCVDRVNMPSQYHGNDVYVSTSIAETFGVAICEAISTGLPVVATKSGGVEDTVNKNNGIKVNIKDAEGIAEALICIKMKRIQFDPIIARNSIVEKYGSNAFRAKLTKFYDQAISKEN